ncbi:HTH-type transcriptional regulator BetI [Peptococcaceae bacterium CEB3]|nr:HTH-type transcriptional regulator BetI [Peptococcaceae bacterium CEB3]
MAFLQVNYIMAEKLYSLVRQFEAALRAFSTNGYKKASASDIANAGGISKAMVFHYFGSKKALYLYLIEFCSNMFKTEMNDNLDITVTDFFDRIKMITVLRFHL